MGYSRHRFEVVGVDIHDQPRYPFEFHQADAITYLMDHYQEFDFIHASPPCQAYSKCQRLRGREHPDLLSDTRNALRATGKPYVIENVGGAADMLLDPVMLCGAMFNIETYRHRYFEAGGGFYFDAPDHPEHRWPQAKMGRAIPDGHFGIYVGNFAGIPKARRVLDVPWMNREGIRECIPPVYTTYIGLHVGVLVEAA